MPEDKTYEMSLDGAVHVDYHVGTSGEGDGTCLEIVQRFWDIESGECIASQIVASVPTHGFTIDSIL